MGNRNKIRKCFGTVDFKEGTSLLEKRKAVFTGNN
jgi:hypothetical protein